MQAIKALSGDGYGIMKTIQSRTKSAPKYDVFISYRRAGGSDFAQLLKLQLKERKLEVFLDVENLGAGDFSSELQSSLKNSKNVVLVWTQGCMDRIINAETQEGDFVRLECAFASV